MPIFANSKPLILRSMVFETRDNLMRNGGWPKFCKGFKRLATPCLYLFPEKDGGNRYNALKRP
jgi:hypothetical protein